jgi:hypothetical protein
MFIGAHRLSFLNLKRYIVLISIFFRIGGFAFGCLWAGLTFLGLTVVSIGTGAVPLVFPCVVGKIETRTFKDQSGSGAYQTARVLLAALGAFLYGCITHGLEAIEPMATGITCVTVSRHILSGILFHVYQISFSAN